MADSEVDKKIKKLRNSTKMKFAKWDKDKKKMPVDVSGVYIVWKDSDFAYAGMAGIKTSTGSSSTKPSKSKPKGILRRLGKHASGNRGGNMFCVYVGDRYIVPHLSKNELTKLKDGKLKLDGRNGKIRDYIRTNFTYQYLVTADAEDAKELERAIRRGETTLGKPFLNPSSS